MTYDAKMRAKIIETAKGKVVKSLEWVDDVDGPYWVMTFDDDSEISFRFMVELES